VSDPVFNQVMSFNINVYCAVVLKLVVGKTSKFTFYDSLEFATYLRGMTSVSAHKI